MPAVRTFALSTAFHIDLAHLEAVARKQGARIDLLQLPGGFMHHDTAMAPRPLRPWTFADKLRAASTGLNKIRCKQVCHGH